MAQNTGHTINYRDVYRRFLFIVLIVTGCLLGVFVQATSGACSSHGGVNCRAGRQTNGTVYCVDGWSGSMVQYDYMMMCQGNLANLDPQCVQEVTDYIKGRDTALKDYNQALEDYTDKAANISDPGDRQRAIYHLNYLRTARDMQVQSYIGYTIDACLNYQPTPRGTLCNGKYWDDCPAGLKFLCPQSGDAQCGCGDDLVLNKNNQCITKIALCMENYGNNSFWNGSFNDNGGPICDCTQGFTWNTEGTACVAQQDSNQTTNNDISLTVNQSNKNLAIMTATEEQKPMVENKQIKPDQKPTANNNNELISTQGRAAIATVAETTSGTKNTELKSDNGSWQPGLFQRIWSWIKALFGN